MYTKKVTRRNPETGIVETVSVPMTTEETLARQAEEDQATIDAAAQEISDKLSGIKDEAERRILAITLATAAVSAARQAAIIHTQEVR